jgi:hypothetical protein
MSTEAASYPLCLNTPTGGPSQYDMPPRVAEGHEPGKRAAIADVLWPDRVVQVGFVNPLTEWGKTLRQQVQTIAPVWSQYANIEFQFTEGWTEDITINFEPDPAQKWGYGTYFSYLGTDARNFSRSNKPSMCLIFDPNDRRNDQAEFQRVILHEFGHALGLIHEHMRPDRPIVWNLQEVWRQYSSTGWDWNMIVAQVVRAYGSDPREKPIIDQTPFDPQSIMMYPFPAGLAYYQDGKPFVSDWNRQLTQNDIDLVSRSYPK